MDSHSSTERQALVSWPSGETTDPARRPRRWHRVGTILTALAVVSGGLALAVSQHWVSLATLRPFLFALPCALIVLLCFSGSRPSSKPEPNA